ncbi:hypothetical protein KBD13_03145 [Patescibacteria group bacterium]|nr:hypothetical protein [Patescibacteria group bacterium]
MAKSSGATGTGGGTHKTGGREDSISELVAARLLGFLSQILGGWIGTSSGLKESLERVGGGNVVSMLEKARTAFWFAFGGDEANRSTSDGFFTGLIDAVKDAKDPAEANTKMDAFFSGPVAKAFIDKKDVLGKQPLMSFADALAAMSEGDDKKEIRTLIKGLSDADLASVMTRQTTPAQLHGLAQIAAARPPKDAWKLLLTLPEPPKKGADKVASEAQQAFKAVKDLLDLLKSEEDSNDPAVQADRAKHEEALRLTRRRARGMRRVRTILGQRESSGWFGRLLFVLIALAIAFLVVWKLSFLRS